MTEQFDIVVLGTGNAGMAAAGALRAAGKSVAMIESWDVGGTCPLRGCVPKKVLVAAAQVLHQIALAPAHHIEVGAPKLDWAGLIARERGFVDGVAESFANSLEGRGIELIRGQAKFTGPNRIVVGERVLEAGKIVIATGSKPRPLAIPGAEHLITSEAILEMAELPARLVFIGGGVDDHLRSVSNSRVYVAGDALWSSAQLSPLASHEGRVVAENILNGDTVTPDYDTAPSAVFAVPALAGVGLTEEAATARGLRFAVKANDLTAWRSSQTHAETAGFSKVLIEAETDRILGAHILGHGAEEIVHLFAFAMKHGITARGLGDTVTAYPTFSADIKHML